MRHGFAAFIVAVCALICVPAGYLVLLVAGGDAGAAAVLARAGTWWAVVRTLALGAAAAAVCVGLSVPLAWLTHATDLPGRRLFRVALNLPLAVPSYVGAFVVVALFAPGGVLVEVWAGLGLPEIYGGVGATLALLFSYPLALLPVQASLARTDPRLWESARSLGATPWRAFRRVILPGLRPAMTTGALLVGLYAVGDFGAVSLMRYRSLSYLIYVRYKSLFGSHEAAVLSLLLIAVTVALVLLMQRARGRVSQALDTRGERRAWPVVRLGRWRWPALGLCLLVLGCGAGLPVLVVLRWLVRGLQSGNEVAMPWAPLWRSLQLGVIAGAVLVAAALVPALWFRYGGRRGADGGPWVRLIVHVGYALPGIVVALALVSLAANHVAPLYQTVALLIVAFVLRFFPLALQTLDEAIAAHSRGLFWAARSLGCGTVAAWWRAVIPNARPAMAAAFLAVFVAVIKELPLTLLLSPPNYATLSTEIWMLTEDAYFAAVSPTVLAMLAVATAVLLFAPRRAERPR
ncbi:ABC transporter permease [Haliangium sp.]|uniref:ABC transporter permease n=1 Tax=Haliangium sp. TaxID=2663208 RepID=UPI003D128046